MIRHALKSQVYWPSGTTRIFGCICGEVYTTREEHGKHMASVKRRREGARAAAARRAQKDKEES